MDSMWTAEEELRKAFQDPNLAPSDFVSMALGVEINSIMKGLLNASLMLAPREEAKRLFREWVEERMKD